MSRAAGAGTATSPRCTRCCGNISPISKRTASIQRRTQRLPSARRREPATLACEISLPMPATYYADAGPLWAITSYYNPNRYWRRRANYAQFRRFLDLPLLAVELNLGGSFELAGDDAEILIRCEAGDVMWQKERLLNIALAALPKECELVAWIDCDVILPRPDWTRAVCRHLEQHAIVQPFSQVLHLQPDANLTTGDWSSQTLFSKPSIASLVLDGIAPETYMAELPLARQGTRNPGHAWAAGRETIEAGGIYHASIIGGGDTLLAGAAFGGWVSVIRRQFMNERQAESYRRWAEPFYATVQGKVGCLEQDSLHLW